MITISFYFKPVTMITIYISGPAYAHNSVVESAEKEDDVDLKQILEEFSLQLLYPKFLKAGVDKNFIWDLEDEILDKAQLTTLEKMKYINARLRLGISHISQGNFKSVI